MTCNEEFSNRYFARHTCKKKPIDQTSAASDQDVQTTNLSETPSTSRATVDCFMETEETEACAASDLEMNELSSDTESDCGGTVIDDELLEMIIQSRRRRVDIWYRNWRPGNFVCSNNIETTL